MLLERAKPDLFSEDCDAAAPGSSAPPDALAALDQVDDDRCTPEEPPAISVTPATPHGEHGAAVDCAVTPVLPSAHLTPPSSPQPFSRHLHSTPHGHHASNLIHLATPSRTCNVNPFSPERALPRHVPSSPMPSPCPSPVRGAPPSPAGSRYLEDFEEIEKIGTGSFSEVFKARNRVDGWLYAVKQAKRAFSSPADMHNTLKEVYALAALGSHPHVVRYYSAWVEDRLYIQTEYCSGGSLADHLKKGVRFTEAQLIDVLRQVAQGLSHIHRKGLAHLDVKPENIYVDLQDDGVTPLYKIGDLGLISLADATDFSEGDSRYISRDLFASDVDCRKLTKADIFSLGCSVYELALGRALPSRGEEWNAIREGEIQLSSDFTRGFENLLKSMLAADADKRPSADELLQAPAMCSEEMKWDIEHKKRVELEEQVRALQAELSWRRDVMNSSGWRACESLVPLVAKLEGYMSFLAPPSPISADSSPRPGMYIFEKN